MKELSNKMQSAGGAQSQEAVCRKCGGIGKTKMANGNLQMCYECHGTGKAGRGTYQTK